MYGPLATEFYDLNTPHASWEEMELYTSIFSKDDLILEAMCGSGRVLIPLLQQGFQIHGVDNSPAMVAVCKRRAEQQGLSPVLFEDSVDTMILPQKYDAIIIPFGSFQLLHPLSVAEATLNNFHKHLKPGGTLILDLCIPLKEVNRSSCEPIEHEIIASDGGKIRKKTYLESHKNEHYFTGVTIFSKIKENVVTDTEQEEFCMRWYEREHMTKLLEVHHFPQVHIIEDNDTRSSMTHMIFIAQRT